MAVDNGAKVRGYVGGGVKCLSDLAQCDSLLCEHGEFFDFARGLFCTINTVHRPCRELGNLILDLFFNLVGFQSFRSLETGPTYHLDGIRNPERATNADADAMYTTDGMGQVLVYYFVGQEEKPGKAFLFTLP